MRIISYNNEIPKTYGQIADKIQDYEFVLTGEELQEMDETSDFVKMIEYCGGLSKFVVGKINNEYHIQYNLGLLN